MKKLGVDVSHFEREGVKWTREVLEGAVAASTTSTTDNYRGRGKGRGRGCAA
jgi:hypothetical protein